MYFDLIRLGIPQSVLAFIFIGRRSRTPLQVSLHKNLQNKTKLTRTRTGQTDRLDRSVSEPVRIGCQHMPPAFW